MCYKYCTYLDGSDHRFSTPLLNPLLCMISSLANMPCSVFVSSFTILWSCARAVGWTERQSHCGRVAPIQHGRVLFSWVYIRPAQHWYSELEAQALNPSDSRCRCQLKRDPQHRNHIALYRPNSASHSAWFESIP